MASKIKIILLFLLLSTLSQCCTQNLGGCQACSSNLSQCTKCFTGYYLHSAKCELCYSICMTCSQVYDCTSCFDGYYWSSILLWCMKCPSNCQLCTNGSLCMKCKEGYYLTEGSCSPCIISSCSSCNQTICDSCSLSYYLSENLCKSCSKNCANCTNSTTCTICSEGYYWDYLSLQCQACSADCKKCNMQICQQCLKGYYLIGQQCFKCEDKCVSCISAEVCLQCAYSYVMQNNSCAIFCPLGYYLQNRMCFSCGDNCSECQGFVCTACLEDYYLYNSTCLKRQQQNGFAINLAYLIVPLAILVIIIIAVVCGYKKCKGREHIFKDPVLGVEGRSQSNLTGEIEWQLIQSSRFGDQCTICLDTGNTILQCGHIFHVKCLSTWLKRRSSCPTCRVAVNYKSVTIVCSKCLRFGFSISLAQALLINQSLARVCGYCWR